MHEYGNELCSNPNYDRKTSPVQPVVSAGEMSIMARLDRLEKAFEQEVTELFTRVERLQVEVATLKNVIGTK